MSTAQVTLEKMGERAGRQGVYGCRAAGEEWWSTVHDISCDGLIGWLASRGWPALMVIIIQAWPSARAS